ncbi:MAG: D-2-hydroxyacid dehydrogenase, partial [Novosphingobium sp.]|nr:D-2-hydroxyacid dehydrogenase [Novosphingobium sp.]
MTVAVLPGKQRQRLEGRLPAWVDARFFDTAEELLALAPEAEIGWFDWFDDGTATMAEAIRRAEKLRWL